MNLSKQDTQLLKGGAIVLVMLYHACGWLGLPNVTQGQTGVDIFIFLSGYGIGKSAQHYYNASSRFLKKRLTAIYVPYLIVVLLAAWAFRPAFTDLFLHLTLLQCASSSYCFGLDDALWYLSLASWAYLFVAWMNRGTWAPYMVAAGFAASILLFYLFHGREPMVSHLVPRFPIFFLGYWFGEDKSASGYRPAAATLLAALLFFLFAIVKEAGIFSNIGLASFLAFMILQASSSVAPRSMLLWLGEYSYELYLLHDFAMRYVILHLAPSHGFMKYAIFPVAAPVLIALGAVLLRWSSRYILAAACRTAWGKRIFISPTMA